MKEAAREIIWLESEVSACQYVTSAGASLMHRLTDYLAYVKMCDSPLPYLSALTFFFTRFSGLSYWPW